MLYGPAKPGLLRLFQVNETSECKTQLWGSLGMQSCGSLVAFGAP